MGIDSIRIGRQVQRHWDRFAAAGLLRDRGMQSVSVPLVAGDLAVDPFGSAEELGRPLYFDRRDPRLNVAAHGACLIAGENV